MSLKYDLLHDVISRDMPNATQKTYRRGISDFCDWAKGQGLNSRKMDSMAPESLKDTIQQYERYLAEKYESPNTIHTRLAPICKAFGVSMEKIDKPQRSATTIIRGRDATKGQRGQADALADKYARVVEFQKAVGLRRSELEKLQGKNLTRDNQGFLCVEVVSGKGGRYQLQRVLPQFEEIVLRTFDGIRQEQRVFDKWEVRNNINFHSMRAEAARAAYRYYAERITASPAYKEKLQGDLLRRFEADNDRLRQRSTKDYEKKRTRFLYDLTRGGGKYELRGDNKARAIQAGRETILDRTALMAASVYHLAHGRTDVAATHYML